ncbi:Zz type zinc finger domain-containing protein [Neofusicoccum parvum]|nr:Zz type zinc finger domain-containing protein [Neofusicoccum parvum]
MATTVPVTMDTLITIKISIQGSNRKFKIPMRDLGAGVLPGKLRQLLNIPENQEVVFERFSDSAGAYITLDPENPQVYKTLFRAAKAKLKLRLRATIVNEQAQPAPMDPLHSMLDAGKPPIPLPVRTAPALPQQSEPRPQPQATSQSPLQAGPSHTGTIPLYPYAKLPAFHKTNMRTSNVPPMPPVLPAKQEQPVDAEGEAPVPKPFSARDTFFSELANMSRERELALRMKESTPANLFSWSVYCNVCDKPMSNEHYHCSICDEGDYDLCANCVAAGHHCPGEGHWLIKRFIKSGKVTNSTTERVAPKPQEEPVAEDQPEIKTEPEEKKMPGAFTTIEKFMVEKKLESVEPEQPTRTCNSCVKVFPEPNFVTCVDCEDYDLCMSCHVSSQHGHHPGHAFKPAAPGSKVGPLAEFLCSPGRNVRHAAVCDGCDKFIYGVRHKCLNCPDWDYCAECIKNAKQAHPMHRFVPIFDPLPEPRSHTVRHFGIYCDGPLCKDKMNQSYIEGVRYKCAVCYDTDFCANCEAHPSSRHNRTHPVIKFKTPVRNVSVTTMGEDKTGAPLPNLGDSLPKRSFSLASANAATQVRTIADLKPSEDIASKTAKVQIKDLLAEPIDEKIRVEDLLAKATLDSPKSPSPAQETVAATELNAHFIRDTICDGTKIPANSKFLQVWTLRNPGPHAWPAGCSVRYVGGDNMLNVNNEHPCSTTDIAEATESNVIGRSVEAGEEISFSVLMKAPVREGVCISYWRLKTADGTPFGHRLWCHIETTKPIPTPLPIESPQSSDAERTLARLRELRERRQSRVQETENSRALQREAMQAMVSRMQRLHEAQEQMKQRQRVLRHELAQKQAERSAAATPPKPTVEDVPEAESSEAPVKKEVEVKSEPTSEDSQMIFPTLEKESPVNSTHESSTPVEADATTVASPSVRDEAEIFEDAETVDLVSSDDGFLTDEEYDVLDASDSEFPA